MICVYLCVFLYVCHFVVGLVCFFCTIGILFVNNPVFVVVLFCLFVFVGSVKVAVFDPIYVDSS